jgi:hypothetical protein
MDILPSQKRKKKKRTLLSRYSSKFEVYSPFMDKQISHSIPHGKNINLKLIFSLS